MRRKVVGILQPVYLPWLGYFEQMAYADQFVFYDDVQYTHHDWRNRNRILTKSGPIWLTVPVRKSGLKALVSQVEIDQRTNWQRKHLTSISQNYQRASHFRPFYLLLERVLSAYWPKISDLDIELIEVIRRHLDIKTQTSRSSDVPENPDVDEHSNSHGLDPAILRKNKRVVEVCRHHDATVFYEGAKGADYINVDYFRKYGIEVVFQNYRHPVYPQRYAGFHSHMSVIDLIMNTGPKAKEIILSSPLPDGLAV